MSELDRILSQVRVATSFFCRCNLTSPWGLRFPDRPFASVHVSVEGRCEVAVDDGATITLDPGDLLFLPRGRGHSLRDAATTRPVPFDSLTYSRTGESGATLAHGGGGTPSVLLCAVVDFAGPGGLLATRLLPEVVTLRKAAAQGTTIAALVAGLGEEAARAEPGSAALMSGLGTALALSILRDASTSVGGLADSAGALGDDRIRRSVLAMHAEPGRPWTVEGLAGTAGMSRSVFASTFAEALGQTPIQYLTRLRIERARELLRESHRSLSAIADELGYGSQEAFSRAFRRETGVTPGAARASAA